ncbi:MAG: Asp-tRNA(Asn)/Glu-tRNA(Gln) amidotransferase subunit GatB [Candidatus Cyclonatronum sp.]|uniref:Asp-tRNA(Asn)/Glu-tRNA(Gln) amidotransferase subunit GatB n=1 Tax=Cyclonatronum sp. TaxID=3024185 RepID=UPI0025C46F9F|nr:Asp-tRNA(Asn)/Glu-tRNA(Gln) amidotransferase subunit GatB [Cyclonatronum sp.]MCC5934270.1 Asp-tRNA(Asn)/Glu-tRNA(Gln) amidotransferase subunit GatB [Balneolales bacterium]MCH8485661.1 Asp-tRNA(Asn)/Glu-tRNA(Gln) amidotransferase subunit GatB [Cyclonatronum sp.]
MTATLTQDTVFETVIGLEVHAQLLTESKAFAPVKAGFGSAPNTNITPLCLGHPGTLPVLNENLVRFIVKMGLATNCTIAPKSIFARKNYFYPDLPKGYQISQYENPICQNGWIEIEDEAGNTRKIGITRIHMEEDAGKSIHDQDPHNTLVDLNRAGTPLMEIVSEPELRSPAEAWAYLTQIRQIVRYLGICDGNMEEGSLRCDANVSIRPKGQQAFGTRTEIKNLNSFRNVERAIAYEVERQKQLLLSGGEVVQQTLLWDPNRMETRQLRSKEEAHDYRYFPDPDLPPVVVTDAMREEIRAELPELPRQRSQRFTEQLGLPAYDARLLTEEREFADFFEALCDAGANPKLSANLMLSEVKRVLNEQNLSITAFPADAAKLAGLIQLRSDNKISSSAMQTIFNEMLKGDEDAEAIAKNLNLIQVSDSSFLEPVVDEVISSHPEEAERFRAGNKKLMGFFVGAVMKQTKGKANPQLVTQMVKEKLEG